jgi:hypothetical protein
MPDRFEQVHFERQPLEVGDCEACDEIIYDYENTKCEMCEAKVHLRCLSRCDYCGKAGCKICLRFEDCLLICEGCLKKRKLLTQTVIANVQIPGYWYTGLEEDDEQIILEYISSDNPKIYVHIDKREAK